MKKITFTEEDEKLFQKWVKQFKSCNNEDVDKWYSDMRIIWWNISHG